MPPCSQACTSGLLLALWPMWPGRVLAGFDLLGLGPPTGSGTAISARLCVVMANDTITCSKSVVCVLHHEAVCGICSEGRVLPCLGPSLTAFNSTSNGRQASCALGPSAQPARSSGGRPCRCVHVHQQAHHCVAVCVCISLVLSTRCEHKCPPDTKVGSASSCTRRMAAVQDKLHQRLFYAVASWIAFLIAFLQVFDACRFPCCCILPREHVIKRAS